MIYTPEEENKINELFNKYETTAILFNKFFLGDRISECAKYCKKILASTNLFIFFGERANDRIFKFHQALKDFYNHWYLMADKNYDNPLSWFGYFLEDPKKHLKHIWKYASNEQKKWLKTCIENPYIYPDFKAFEDNTKQKLLGLITPKEIEPFEDSGLMDSDEW